MATALKIRERTGKLRAKLPIAGMMKRIEDCDNPQGRGPPISINDFRRGVIEDNVLKGQVTMFDRPGEGDPKATYFVMLVVLDTGHLARVPLTKSDFRALVEAARNEGAVVEPQWNR